MKFAFKQLCKVNLSSSQPKTSEGNGGALFIISKTCCFIVLFTKDTRHEAGQDSEFKTSLGYKVRPYPKKRGGGRKERQVETKLANDKHVLPFKRKESPKREPWDSETKVSTSAIIYYTSHRTLVIHNQFANYEYLSKMHTKYSSLWLFNFIYRMSSILRLTLWSHEQFILYMAK